MTVSAEDLHGTLTARLPGCGVHPERPADFRCAGCGGFFCWREVHCSAADNACRCGACTEAEALAASRRRLLAVLREPFTYVGFLALLAMILYLLGAGNLRPGALAVADAQRPWFRKELPRRWLAQAVRARTRSDYLRRSGRDQEARLWAVLAAHRFGEAADAWQGAPVLLDLQIAAAAMRGLAGRADEGRELLAACADGADDRQRAAIRFYRGLIAWTEGDAERAEAAWAPLREGGDWGDGAGDRFGGMVDIMVEQFTENKEEHNAHRKVKRACRTGRPTHAWFREIATLTEPAAPLDPEPPPVEALPDPDARPGVDLDPDGDFQIEPVD